MDVHISNGKILNIGDFPEPENAKIYELEGAYVSPGWFDIGTRLTDPGFESIDDMNSLAKSAIKGDLPALQYFQILNLPMTIKALFKQLSISQRNWLSIFTRLQLYQKDAKAQKCRR